MLLGNAAAQHPQAGAAAGAGALDRRADRRQRAATWARRPTASARSSSARCPAPGGLNAGQMLAQPMKALLLLNVEPVLDAADAAAAAQGAGRRRAGGGADAVQGRRRRRRRRAAADRTVHRDRRHLRQCRGPRCRASTASSSRWARRARPGRCCACWATCSACRASTSRPPTRCAPRRWATWPALAARLDNRAAAVAATAAAGRGTGGLQRIADVPIYATDALVRRAASLQRTADARAPRGRPAVGAVAQLGLHAGRRACACRRARRGVVLPARRGRHAGAERACASPPAIPTPRRWARCSAPSTVEKA